MSRPKELSLVVKTYLDAYWGKNGLSSNEKKAYKRMSKELIEIVYMNHCRYGEDGNPDDMNIFEFWSSHYNMERLDRFKPL